MDRPLNLRSNLVSKDPIGVSRASEIIPAKWRFLNFSYLEKISPGNQPFYAEILAVFQSESALFLTNVAEQLKSNDLFSVARSAHAMKPTGAYIGAEELSVLIRSLEIEARKSDATRIPTLMIEIRSIIAHVNKEIDEYLKSSK